MNPASRNKLLTQENSHLHPLHSSSRDPGGLTRPSQANPNPQAAPLGFPEISIVIPFYNEEDCVHPVLSEVRQTNPTAEIIAVDDGSSDNTAARIHDHPDVRCICFLENLGQSAALYAGLIAATQAVCAMMDGDGQNDPADIPYLVAQLDQADFVCGYRRFRRDVPSRRLASWLANRVRRLILHDGIRDMGCTLKAIRREHVRFLVPFSAMHRFLPVFLANAGLKGSEFPVNHRPRRTGNSKYSNLGRASRGLFDLIGVCWLLKRQILWPKDFASVRDHSR